MQPVLEMLEYFGLEKERAGGLLDEGHIVITDGGIEVRPPEEFVRGLTSDQREELYGYVAPFELANPYHNPFVLHPDGFRFMNAMSPSRLSPEVVDEIDALTYQRRGNGCYFSDLHLCLAVAGDPAERARIVKTIGRQFSRRLQLRVPHDRSLADLSGYWSADGRNADVLPVLEAVAGAQHVDLLDVVHLLPTVPRTLLNSYPSAEMMVDGEWPDCFSTTLSFFAEEPHARYMDSIVHVIQARYEKATPPWRLGDVVLIRDPDSMSGTVLHACNYVAADIVFTKNGADLMRPWILSRLSDVMNQYLKNERLSAAFFRLKPEFRR